MTTPSEQLETHATVVADLTRVLRENDGLCDQIAKLEAERDALAKFKAYVHKRLDDAEVPVDPPSVHREQGCRIGGRLDVVFAERDRLKAQVAKLKTGFAIVHAGRADAESRYGRSVDARADLAAQLATAQSEGEHVGFLLAQSEAEKEALRKALEQYGCHSQACRGTTDPKPGEPCTCGLDAALASSPPPASSEPRATFDRILPAIREAARSVGYALGVHGSLARDLDVIAAPWTEHARPVDELVRAVADAAEKVIGGETFVRPSRQAKPHGRVAWQVWLGVGDVPYVDLSVLPASSDASLRAQVERLASLIQRAAADLRHGLARPSSAGVIADVCARLERASTPNAPGSEIPPAAPEPEEPDQCPAPVEGTSLTCLEPRPCSQHDAPKPDAEAKCATCGHERGIHEADPLSGDTAATCVHFDTKWCPCRAFVAAAPAAQDVTERRSACSAAIGHASICARIVGHGGGCEIGVRDARLLDVAERDSLRAELDKAKAELATLTGERDNARHLLALEEDCGSSTSDVGCGECTTCLRAERDAIAEKVRERCAAEVAKYVEATTHGEALLTTIRALDLTAEVAK